ncbi:hypothetical protein BC940DRAFT_301488 [Gongronella butleri]|nr:hypothetical protein BC940DRAFT_301488 [Gongronella butleri]
MSSNDVRKLFKQQQAQRSQKRVEHPLAKYDNAGRLSCAVCQQGIKSAAVWSSHLTSSEHKHQVSRLKALKQQQQQQMQRKRAADAPALGGDAALLSKRARFEELEREMQQQPSENEDSQDDEEMDDASDDSDANGGDDNDNATAGLPAGFFDDDTRKSAPATSSKKSQKAAAAPSAPAPTTTVYMKAGIHPNLPAGFFDSANEEAKARKVAAPDVLQEEQLEEEYAAFKEQFVETAEESAKMEEADEETILFERDLALAQQQLAYDNKVKELKALRDGKTAKNDEIPSQDAVNPYAITRDAVDPLWSKGMKSSVRNVMKKEATKKVQAVFDDMDMDSDDEDDDDWRAQQV